MITCMTVLQSLKRSFFFILYIILVLKVDFSLPDQCSRYLAKFKLNVVV